MPSPFVPIIQPTELYSIVVLGAMNPRLHYPLWYQVNGSLTKEEATTARESPNFVISPNLAQFDTPDFSINCMTDRWEIKAREVSGQKRILQIACHVFEKLAETPVIAYGFNTMRHLDTKAARVRDVMRRLAIETALGFPSGEDGTCNMTYAATHGEDANQMTVDQSSLAEGKVFVTYNSHYPIPQQNEPYFNLTPLLTAHFQPHLDAANKFCDGVVKRINEIAEVQNAA